MAFVTAMPIPVCPRCDGPLVVLGWNDLEVDICPDCRGLWLDTGELEHLLESTGGVPDDDPVYAALKSGVARLSVSGRRHLCPRCDRRLDEIALPVSGNASGADLLVDVCPGHHGVWFDDGELRAMLHGMSANARAGGALAALGDLLGEPAPPAA